ncbi:MAG TPA: hypothetical protein VIY73_09590, partial [Polyangiaceae bacterium]
LKTTLSAGELLTGNLPLVKDTLQRLAQKTLARIGDLALLDQSDWIARITALDAQATSIPSVLPNDTPETRIARFAKSLVERFAGRFPTAAFVGGLTKSPSSSFATTKAELIAVLAANPSLSIKRTNVDDYVATNKVAISAPALADLKAAQRLFRLSPHYPSVEALNTAGYRSAKSVYFAGRDPFIAQMTGPLGSTALAQMAYARAQVTYATALTTYARFSNTFNKINVSAAASPAALPPGGLANYPDVQSLFGSPDYFQCDDCQSIYSPAAYLVDLLQWLSGLSAKPMTNTGPVAALTAALAAVLYRRPGIQYVALDCNNTNVSLPYIDVVNEVLEAFVSPPSSPLPSTFIIDTTGTSAERRALPQHISTAAYQITQSNVFPLTLPFDLTFSQTAAYLAAMGTSRTAVLTLFRGAPSGPSAADVACASLGINQEMRAVLSESIPIASASNTSPITIKTRSSHGLPSGVQVAIAGVPGNTAANGTFTITVTGATTFTLGGTTGNAASTPGGAVSTQGLPWLRWGFPAQNPSALSPPYPVIDPTTRAPYAIPSPGTWDAALGYVPILL